MSGKIRHLHVITKEEGILHVFEKNYSVAVFSLNNRISPSLLNTDIDLIWQKYAIYLLPD